MFFSDCFGKEVIYLKIRLAYEQPLTPIVRSLVEMDDNWMEGLGGKGSA